MSKRWPMSQDERFWSKVDKSGECWLWTAFRSPDGYGVFNSKVSSSAHRVSYMKAFGDIPAGMQVDHLCHQRACVRPDHLRLATNKQNSENRSGARADSKSGVRGVSWHKTQKRWVAEVYHEGHHFYLGRFSDLEEAKEAVIAKRLELFTHNDMDRRTA